MTRSGNFTPGRCNSPAAILLLAGVLLVAGCAPWRPVESRTLPAAPPALRAKIVTLTRALVGLRYRYGGGDIDGFDCSGLVHYVFHSFGLEIPRTARAQGKMKGRIPARMARPGDILAFRLKSGWHSAVLIDKNRFVHAPGRGKGIRAEEMTRYWKRRLKAVINVIDR